MIELLGKKLFEPFELQQNKDPWPSDENSYPRKQFRRKNWLCLNGPWKFTFDDELEFKNPKDVKYWGKVIEVPFAPESALSGIEEQSFHSTCWYQRDFSYSPTSGNRVFLHFGAVDYSCRVWLNDALVGEHEGGHTPFSFDITSCLQDENQSEGVDNHGHTQGLSQGLSHDPDHGHTYTLTVQALDDPHDLAKPRGKQDWQEKPHSIWYPRTTGIWQTVWIEELSPLRIDRIVWHPNLTTWEIGFEAFVVNETKDDLFIQLELRVGHQILAQDVYQVVHNLVHRRVALSDPGIDDFRNEILWSPEKPTLIEAELKLMRNSEVLDHVRSYTALRGVTLQGDRFLLNNRPYFLRMVLDQGYWPQSLMTPPNVEALIEDITLTRRAGFNGVRKHQKIEDPCYLYWADVLGLLVWEEMPSAYRFTHLSVERLVSEWTAVIDRDLNHPCIVVWVPFNESWGVPDLTEKENHRSCVRALFYLTKTLDPSRPVVGNDGWESTATDILGIHDYDASPKRLLARYGEGVAVPELLRRVRPAGRLLALEGHSADNKPVMLTEFGGIAFRDPRSSEKGATWGYSKCESEEELKLRYEQLMKAIGRIVMFSGFCYTQLTDTFQEANGLFFSDRTPKFSFEAMRAATLNSGF